MLLDRVGKIDLANRDYPFCYSNFGYAVLGAVIERVYGQKYTALVNAYAQELGLANTHISTEGDLGNYWDWKENDAYMSAGALTSDAEDMARYLMLRMEAEKGLSSAFYTISAKAGDTPQQYLSLGIRMDTIGAAWIWDTEHNIVWHNGGTGDYNCYLGFDPEKQVGVIVLSNLPPSFRIPATVVGARILRDLQGG